MPYHERCDALNKIPVLFATYFQYTVEVFFKFMILDAPLGKTQYYAISVEFKVRWSPHINTFIWILNSPKLTKFYLDEYTKWVSSIAWSDLPDAINEPVLLDLIKTYQIHHHSKTCRKDRNEKCKFHLGTFFTSRTIIAQTLEDSSLSDVQLRKI